MSTHAFGGTITQVITSTNDPRYYVGQVFVGYYQFNSGDAHGNGTVHALPFGHPARNHSLKGIIAMTFPDEFPVATVLGDTMNDPHLTIAAGRISTFQWSWQMGQYYFDIRQTTFDSKVLREPDPVTGLPRPQQLTSGTVVMGDPRKHPNT